VESTILCDCGHDRSEHEDEACRECAAALSPDGACRAGGFTNSLVRRTALQQFWTAPLMIDRSFDDSANHLETNSELTLTDRVLWVAAGS
jgi:hypothetical protein